jgi:succinate dehydrogenase/fumarate reductase flavoprotein subunit
VEADVVVIGSGAAGLAAALAAACSGAEVVIVEKTGLLGGTTAMSGGTAWIAANHCAAAAGFDDSPEAALAYLCDGGGETVNRPLLEVFVASGASVLRELERHSPITFYLANDTDYHPELPGGMRVGRSVLPAPFDPAPLGPWARLIRSVDMPLDIAEALGSLNPPEAAPSAARSSDSGERWTRGRALVGSLLCACLDRGVRVLTGHRARRLQTTAGAVTGVEAVAGGDVRIAARRGVVLASGGFEWDRDLMAHFLPGMVEAPGTAPGAEGDGLRMAMAVGAGLGSMSEAWWSPMLRVPGERFEGEVYSRMVVSQRLYPRSLVVNASGRRFGNEAKSYHDVGRDLMTIDSGRGRGANQPAWLVYDAAYRHSYGTACIGPADPDPPWLRPFDDLRQLADHHGIDADGLAATVSLFNRHAENGVDPEYHRGESAYALSKGDRTKDGVFRTLGPVADPPFYAVRLHAGTIGTRGGPLTDAAGRVLDPWGEAIYGLFAAGNVAASPTGLMYPGAGGTLGPALTFGYLAGLAAAGSALGDR